MVARREYRFKCGAQKDTFEQRAAGDSKLQGYLGKNVSGRGRRMPGMFQEQHRNQGAWNRAQSGEQQEMRNRRHWGKRSKSIRI